SVREQATGPKLNRWQKNAVSEIGKAIRERKHRVYLLYGVTGSGKTEIYINLILKALEMDLGAIFLYPEIGLTPLYQERFNPRFPSLVLHSSLNPKLRRKNWHGLRKGLVRVGIGPRSAIFGPVPNLGIIIVDEEHSTSYKEMFRSPYYHAREVAIARSRYASCPVVLGSATPSVETFHRAIIRDYQMIRLPRRIDQRKLPEVQTIDLKREKRRVITNRLREELLDTIARNEQAIIFINRKGYAPVVICPDCGKTVRCPDCGIPLVYYKREAILRCNYCFHGERLPETCPNCHHKGLKMLGIGTERIEETLRKHFGDKVIRVDREKVRSDLARIYTQFKSRDRLLMVGTTLVTKGHDFPNVTLVGVINGDQVLNLPDFRSAEYTFQTLTQVAGRAGRGKRPGRVIVQTHQPNHPLFQSVRSHDYERFYHDEIMLRRELNYPPFCRLILIRLRGKRVDSVKKIGVEIKGNIPSRPGVSVYGPVPSFRRKIGKDYNFIMLIKVKGDHGWLKDYLKSKDPRVSVDVDPISTI
ncbi:MAG TPA: primosomal protein N', partial [bacterium (Candidatus Stahlbacteria)]|nr:primosomal protein N' [Candidatus Stahlbacteria bacterium]